jgi:hypothetical protein
MICGISERSALVVHQDQGVNGALRVLVALAGEREHAPDPALRQLGEDVGLSSICDAVSYISESYMMPWVEYSGRSPDPCPRLVIIPTTISAILRALLITSAVVCSRCIL